MTTMSGPQIARATAALLAPVGAGAAARTEADPTAVVGASVVAPPDPWWSNPVVRVVAAFVATLAALGLGLAQTQLVVVDLPAAATGRVTCAGLASEGQCTAWVAQLDSSAREVVLPDVALDTATASAPDADGPVPLWLRDGKYTTEAQTVEQRNRTVLGWLGWLGSAIGLGWVAATVPLAPSAARRRRDAYETTAWEQVSTALGTQLTDQHHQRRRLDGDPDAAGLAVASGPGAARS